MALLWLFGIEGWLVLRSPSYGAISSFAVLSGPAPSEFSGLASRFGLSIPQGTGQSPSFYVELLKSHAILGAVVDTRYTLSPDLGVPGGSLIDIYRIRGKTAALRREAAIRHLAQSVSEVASIRTGLVTVTVTAKSATLAQQINQRLLDLVNDFNLKTRQSQAAAERRFTEKRLAEVQQELRQAEDRVQSFLQHNRDYRNSPELLFRYDRLVREVARLQQVYTTLSDAFERAKIEEVRDTPVITVVESPVLPVRPVPRGLVPKGLLGLMAGALLGSLLAFSREALQSTDTKEAATFAELRQEVLNDVRRPWRALRTALGAKD
jgi:uncharacterized protein involved in exopolysaccharide biosynthesis